MNTPARCSFTETDWQLLSKAWYPVAHAAEILEAPVKAVLLDQPLVLYRTGGELTVAKDVCPHRGVPLSMGSNDGEGIVCPYHGLRFGNEGRCNRIPASPSQAIPRKLNLHTFAAIERYGLVWVCLALRPDEVLSSGLGIPEMPHWEDPTFQQIVCPAFDVAAFAGRQVEGFIDVAHFAWVHTDTFANAENAEVPPYATAETEYGFQADYYSTVPNYPIQAENRSPADYVWQRHFQVYLPFTATLTVHFPDNGRLIIMNAASPVSSRHTRLFAPIARNFDKHIPVESVYAFNLKVFEEDRRLVEAQCPESLPLDPSLEGHIPADMSSIAYRRALRAKGYSNYFLG